MNNTNLFNRLSCLLTSVFLITASISVAPCVYAAGNTYYVSAINGNDDYSGTESKPFKTITKAASVMVSGDTCYVKSGTYNEAVEINNKSNLTFKAHGSDEPLIFGADAISGWTQSGENNIWVAQCPNDAFIETNDKINSNVTVKDSRLMVFTNGELSHEARWPNITESNTDSSDEAYPLLQRSTYASVASVSGDSSVTLNGLPDADLTGAYLWVASGVAYWSYNLDITASSGETLTVTGGEHGTKENDICFVYGDKDLMDIEGEWYLDKSDSDNKRLYYYTENPGGPQNVSIRTREYAIKVTNSSNIVFEGINAKGAIVQLGSGSSECAVKGAVLETLDKRYPTTGAYSYRRGKSSGVLLGGENNLIYGCEIKNMHGRGISIEGNSNRAINNFVHDINFEHNNFDDGIRIYSGANHAVYRNTITRTGRSSIGAAEGCTSSVIAYNYMDDSNRLSKDSGLMYFNNNNYGNTEIHHNILGPSVNNVGMQYGLYLDSFTSGMIVYNNLIYGQETEGKSESRTSVIGPNTIGNVFANNTYINTKNISGFRWDRSGTVYINNLFTNEWKDNSWNWEDMTETNNVIIDEADLNSDYTLPSDSGAIDVGIEIPGITDGYVGTAPDCGAFEHGKEKWTAGHDFSVNYENDTLSVNTDIPFRNLLRNSNFELDTVSDNTIDEWVGEAQRLPQSSWSLFGTLTKNRSYSAMLSPDGEISQTVTGLKPYTLYEAGGYAAVAGPWYKAGAGYGAGGTYSGVSYPDTTATGFKDGVTEYIKYPAFTLDAGYDTIVFGVRIDSSKEKVEKSITLRKNSADGEALITCNMGGSSYPFYGGGVKWDWVHVTIPEALRGQTLSNVYLVFEGDGFNTYGGYYLYNSGSDEKVTLTASGAVTSSVDINASRMPDSRATMSVMTDENGQITLTAKKSGGVMYGYVDELFLREALIIEEDTTPCEIRNISVTDSNGRTIYGIRLGAKHIISGYIYNGDNTADAVKIKLTAHNSNGTVYAESSEKAYAASAGGLTPFALSISAAKEDGAYFTVTITDGKNKSSHIVTDADLEAQNTDSGKAFLKSAEIFDEAGKVLEAPVRGKLNVFRVTAKNNSNSETNMQVILAIYDGDNRLVKAQRFNSVLQSGVNQFALGTVLPDAEGISAKLFTWADVQSLKPNIETAVFK